MTGIDRLRTLAGEWDAWGLGGALNDVADQIEREHACDEEDEDRDAITWVREHGGICGIERTIASLHDHVYRRQRQIDESHAALRRRNGRIAELERERDEDREAIRGLRALLADVIRGVQAQCEAFGVDVSECDDASNMLHDMNEALSFRLMPEGMEWPRFEDGAPVRFGDVVSDGDETGRVYYVTFDTVNPVIIGFTDETPDQDPGTYLEVSVSDGERVKRPAPKVLDADGVEICEGDALYYTPTGCKVTVRDINSDGTIELDGHENRCWRTCLFTHRAPVLAADGKPLREGETVWSNGGCLFVVEDATDPDAVKCRSASASTSRTTAPSSFFTHERPAPKCRDCAHWQKDPQAKVFGVCWLRYHERDDGDCYEMRFGSSATCKKFKLCNNSPSEREK